MEANGSDLGVSNTLFAEGAPEQLPRCTGAAKWQGVVILNESEES